MLNTTEDDVFIAPRSRDAAKIAAMIKHQGDGRGFILSDETLVIFNSYGNTHTSMSRFFGLHRGRLRINLCLIFRLTEIYVELSLPQGGPLEHVFTTEQASLLRQIYKYLGVAEPRLVND